MPRIHTITTDTVITDNDMILGTDGASGANKATKNFSFGVFKNYLWTNVTFTGDLNVSGGHLILDNNKFLQSKLANGTVIDLIGINASNVVKVAQDNQAVTFGQGTVTLGGALSVANNPVSFGGTLGVTGNTTLGGTLSVAGNTNLDGNVTLGNAGSDTITFTGAPTFNTALTFNNTVTVGSNGTGHAVTFHSAATGRALTYDPTNDADGMSKLMFGENMKAQFGTNTADLAIYNDDTSSFIDAGTTAGHLYIRNRGDQKDIIFQAEDGEGGTSPSYETYFMLDGSLSEAGTAGVNYTRWPDKASTAYGDVIGGELHGGEIGVYNKHLNIQHMISPSETEKNINIYNYSNDGDINLATDNGSGGSTIYIKLDGGEKKIYLNETIVFDSVSVQGIQTSGESFADDDISLMTSAAIDDRINSAVATADSLEEILAVGNTTGSTHKISVGSGIDFQDNAKIRMGHSGTGNDLQLYHDGSDSYVSDTGTGNLYIKGGNDVRIVGDTANSDTIWAVFKATGTELWHDGNKKLETKSFGIQTTGSLNIHGAYQFPISDGSAGQVLKTDGSGTLSFADDATGLLGIQQGGNFTNSLIIGHDGTGSLDNALGNTAVGVGAMNAITSGDHNVAFGHDALGALTEGLSNVAIGKQALFTVTDQDNNVAVGKDALYNNTANNNTAVGMNAGVNITSGQDNVLMGYLAGQAMTAGYENVVVGKDAAKSMSGNQSTTFKNVVIGTEAYKNRTSGTNNVVIGHGAVSSGGTGGIGNNGVVGGAAGTKMTVGSNSNTVIGYGADISATGSDNEIVIGKDADGLGSNKAVIGSSSITNIAPGADGTVSLGDDSRGFEELILTSPNGTKYRVKVADNGTLSATAV